MLISIVGSGNVGGALGRSLASKGFNVMFYDVSRRQLEKIGDYKLTMLFDDVLKADVVFVCVPTEALPNGDCDMTIYEGVINHLKAGGFGGLVVQTSTCPPLTARRLSELLPNYVVCPSHYQMSRMYEDALNPVRIMVGTKDGLPNMVMAEIFSKYSSPLFFMSYEQAELTKYAENTLAASLISFWNELFLICNKLKELGYVVDSDEVARIVNVAPCWRSVYRFHGKAYGSLCLPKDTKAFINWCRKELNVTPQFALSADNINTIMKNKFGVESRHSNYQV